MRDIPERDPSSGYIRTFFWIIGLYVLFGVSMGLVSLFLIYSTTGSGSQDIGSAIATGMYTVVVFAFMFLSGPLLAIVAGLFSSTRESGYLQPILLGGISSFIGFYVMFFSGFLCISGGTAVIQSMNKSNQSTEVRAEEPERTTGFDASDINPPKQKTKQDQDISKFLLPLVLASFPVALAGAGSGFISKKLDSKSS